MSDILCTLFMVVIDLIIISFFGCFFYTIYYNQTEAGQIALVLAREAKLLRMQEGVHRGMKALEENSLA
jgi:hypothetical protein